VDEEPTHIENENQQEFILQKMLKVGRVKTKGGKIKNHDGEIVAESKKIK
jgi:hypothetical protein